MAQNQTTYDEIPYNSHPFPLSHPDRLAAIAYIFGLDAPTVDKCRVLELGCSMGGNLIAIAQKFPRARLVGIDASSRQIAQGWKIVDTLGLKNIELQHMDILDVSEALGKFDYIISHGVYSWVPPAVQNKILDLCKRHLAPNGVAYVSYNTYPGWHVRGIVRDMMLFRGMQFNDPSTRLAQAKSLVEFVAKSSVNTDNPYRKLLQSEFDVLMRSDDYYLHHEHLEENNHPVYFHEFARRLAVNGLQYLGEAEFSTMVSTNFPPDVAKTLQDLGAHDILQMEQYMDYVRCRYFRQTLICHSAIKLNRQLRPALVRNLSLATAADPVPAETPPVTPANETETFRTAGGRGITCKSVITKHALRTLRTQWPASVKFGDLLAQCARLSDVSEDFLANEMLACMAAGVVEWRMTADPFTTDVPDVPATTPSARLQAAQGNQITNLREETVALDDIHRIVLRHLEGRQDHAALIDTLVRFMIAGGHQLRRENSNAPVTNPAEMHALMSDVMDKILKNLAVKALLLRPSSRPEETASTATAAKAIA